MTIHRKLIRPRIKEVIDSKVQPPEVASPSASSGGSVAAAGGGGMSGTRRKQVPAEQTNAESFYYLKQMQTKTPMVFILMDGEQIRGYIEWYDRHCLKVNRHKEPNLMIMKQCIKYMYKQEDETKQHRRRKRATTEDSKEATPAPAAAATT